jgi:hypothetical protein
MTLRKLAVRVSFAAACLLIVDVAIAVPPASTPANAASREAGTGRPEGVATHEAVRRAPAPRSQLTRFIVRREARPPAGLLAPRAGAAPAITSEPFGLRGEQGGLRAAPLLAANVARWDKPVEAPHLFQHSLDHPLPARVAREKLDAVETRVANLATQDKHPVVIFDIDDTLVRTPTRLHPDPSAVPGAAAYVKAILSAGATVVYLSGRGEDERQETVDMLAKFGIPHVPRERLMLNPSDKPTVEWKTDALKEIVKLGEPVAAFDNEKENARMFRRELPESDVAVFRLDTSSKRKDPGGTGPIYVIKNFTPAVKLAP